MKKFNKKFLKEIHEAKYEIEKGRGLSTSELLKELNLKRVK